MSTYTRANCIVCGARFTHEDHTEQTCSRFCDRALDTLDAGLECTVCKGMGRIKVGNDWQTCDECRGTGDEQNGKAAEEGKK